MKHKNVDEMICRTTRETFQKFWKENKRHERALTKIFENDSGHQHTMEEVGSVSIVHPHRKSIVTFYRCGVCMKDLTKNEVQKLKSKS